MYYVWKKDHKLSVKYAHFGVEPEGFDIDFWTSGKKLNQNPSSTIITMDEDRPTELTDLLLTSFNIQIFSPKLIQIFKDMGIENIEYYPVIIINPETGDTNETYKAVRIIGEIACLDVANSECEYFTDGELLDVTEFRLHEEKIKPTSEMTGTPFIFRLAEFPFIILVEESVKERLEKERITGVKFVAPIDYVG